MVTLMRKACFVLFLIILSAALCNAQSEPKLDTNTLKAIENSTPAALPQKPIVPKERTDAEDEGLKGKVKSITGESQDLSGTGSVDERHFSYIETYNEKGNLVKRISFDYKGDPSDIAVYGYLNGARVSKINSIRYEYDPPPAMMRPGTARKSDQKQRDIRITYSFGYKYVDGKLAEMQMYHNDGSPGMRYTHTRKGNVLENLAYDDKGALNQKYVLKLDKNGNKIEETYVNAFQQTMNGDRKYVYNYNFDKEGNWTKKTASKIVLVNGKEDAKPSYINFRTITYFK